MDIYGGAAGKGLICNKRDSALSLVMKKEYTCGGAKGAMEMVVIVFRSVKYFVE